MFVWRHRQYQFIEISMLQDENLYKINGLFFIWNNYVQMDIYATLSLLAPTNTRLIRVHSRVMIVYDNKVDQIQLDCSSRLDSLK